MGRKKREYDDDDGHVIANMNVDGMPWYRKEQPWDEKNPDPRYDKAQTRSIIMGTLKAALLIAGAFLGAFLVFILILCVVAWIRYK